MMDTISISNSDSWYKRLTNVLYITLFVILFSIIFCSSYCMYMIIYCSLIIFSSFWITCSIINNILKQNQPITLDKENFSWYNYIRHLLITLYNDSRFVTILTAKNEVKLSHSDKIKIKSDQRHKKIKSFDPLLNTVDGRVHFLTETVNQRFIASWYKSLISCSQNEDDMFCDESKVILDSLFKRLLFTIPFINTDKVVVECLAVILRHLKEFRRAKKRIIKQYSDDMENAYRYILPQNKKEETLELHAHKLTINVMREFITWELWNSFPCNLLVSILSQKVTLYIINSISKPDWLINTMYYLLNPVVVPSNSEDKIVTDSIDSITKNDTSSSIDDKGPCVPIEDNANVQSQNAASLSTATAEQPKLVHREKPAEVYFADPDSTKLDTAVPTVLGNDNLIEEPLAESDKAMPLILDCTDSLDWSHFSENNKLPESIPTTLTVSYKTVVPNVKEYQSTDVISPSAWNVDDYDFIAMGQDLLAQTSDLNLGKHLWNFSADSEESSTTSVQQPKRTTESESRALEPARNGAIPNSNGNGTTDSHSHSVSMSSLFNKEFQQRSAASVSDAMHKIGDLQDEAAGYVEGIIDFGMAGLKKGLRLTGLQDNTTIKFTKTSPKTETEKLHSSADSEDLEKVLSNIHSTLDAELGDSPEYEEPTDLASSVAKLKSIIQQKTSAESASNTPDVSPMYGDPIEGSIDIQDSNYGIPKSMPLTDNLFARVTGVFNTIRTALPGNTGDLVPQNTVFNTTTLHPMSQRWMYSEREGVHNEVQNLIEILLVERSDFCNIDTAYEAVDSFDFTDNANTKSTNVTSASVPAGANIKTDIKPPSTPHETSYDDDLDECFSNIPKCHLLMDIVCELLKDTMNCTGQEPIVRSVLLLFGNWLEDVISNFSKVVIHKSDNIDSLLKNMSNQTQKDVTEQELITLIENSIPGYLQTVIGKNDIEQAIKFFLESFKYESINRDIFVTLLEIITTNVIQSNLEVTPKPSLFK